VIVKRHANNPAVCLFIVKKMIWINFMGCSEVWDSDEPELCCDQIGTQFISEKSFSAVKN